MNKIPDRLKAKLRSDPFYARCCVTGRQRGEVKIEWHHNLIFAGRQVQEQFAILPVAQEIHSIAGHKAMKERLDWIMWNRATERQIDKYSKAQDKRAYRDYLNNKFGVWRAGIYIHQLMV